MKVLESAKTIVLAPIHVLQLATSAKSFLDHPLIGSERLNRMGLHKARVRIADALCRSRRRRLARHVPAEWKEAFDRDGFVVVENVVPEEDFAALRSAILETEWPAREMRQGDAITRRIAIDPDMLAQVPALKRLLHRKDINALFHYVASFRTTPLHYVQTIVSKNGHEGPDPQQEIHADSFHSSMKAWLFLNPVTEEDGPFTYVPGSHRFTPERIAWEHNRSLRDPHAIDRLSARGSPRADDEELAEMNLGKATPLPLPANTLVVADTGGFHARGPSQHAGSRVEIWSYARRNPFQPWVGGDVLSLRGIAERRIGWLWAFRDRFKDQIGQPWQPVGKRRPAED
ncbi:phytanoyl-CoA dioxygenase family protein [Erythrobacter rubeus]|uniref:Phytanoyl-CoA dioxygenase family protein n=1 Tax=Erythrobacter rubeus TaxID=2760803 RepID=A0ABR8KS28_9SPHN|nr:phytanoyl-CoA dioxygenase family protein [Erythrobacter rubeus]MBD2841047.1 phytanoyl-CoA dioxygenase family protein [Erythrobacter rubeus]